MYHLHPRKALLSTKTCVRYVRVLFSSLVGGGPLVYGRGDEPILALSGFYPEDAPAVNLLAFVVYQQARGMLDVPPLAAVPIVNEKAFLEGPAVGEGGDIYFDFLELKTEVVREINRYYHASRPRVVVVFQGGKEFEVVTTTDLAAEMLSVKKITPSPHTPEGAFTLKYSHGIVVRIPPNPREFYIISKHIADLLRVAAKLPPVERRPVKVEKRPIYLLHGGKEVDDGVILDNDVHIYLG